MIEEKGKEPYYNCPKKYCDNPDICLTLKKCRYDN